MSDGDTPAIPPPPSGPVLVIADDLTGANATAAGLAGAGMRAVTVTDAEQPEVVAEFVSRFDAVVVSANNRHEAPERASERVRRALRAGWPAAVVSNRIDSTLRGNVGATTAALVEECERLSGVRTVALCVPAHPDAGRQTVDGVQLLAGVRLEETELARDVRSPVADSRVLEILGAQTSLPMAQVPLSAVTGPADALVATLEGAVADGARVVVVDALTAEHVARVATAAAAVVRRAPQGVSAMRWLAVDPGPLTVSLARALGAGAAGRGAPYLVVSGSATELTRRQLAHLRSHRSVHVVRTATTADGGTDVDATTTALAATLGAAAAHEVVLLASVVDATDLRSGTDGERIPAELARIARRVLEEHQVDGLYATGGDVAFACFAELGADGLDVYDEVVPLAVGGTLVGGPWSGLPVVTKGGLVGDDSTAEACLAFLEQTADLAARHVPPAASRVHAPG